MWRTYNLHAIRMQFACMSHANLIIFACENVSLTFFFRMQTFVCEKCSCEKVSFACENLKFRMRVASAKIACKIWRSGAKNDVSHAKFQNLACESHQQKLHVKFDVLVRKMMFCMQNFETSHAARMRTFACESSYAKRAGAKLTWLHAKIGRSRAKKNAFACDDDFFAH